MPAIAPVTPVRPSGAKALGTVMSLMTFIACVAMGSPATAEPIGGLSGNPQPSTGAPAWSGISGSLPRATRLVPYQHRLTAAGGASYVMAAGTLPRGLSLSVDGKITGIPEKLSRTTFTIRAISLNGQSSWHDFDLVVSNPVAGQEWQGGLFAGDYSLVASSPLYDVNAPVWGPAGVPTGVKDPKDGNANTRSLMSLNPSQFASARSCDNLVLGGFDDWYLPADGELLVTAGSASQLGMAAGTYISSAESDSNFATAVTPGTSARTRVAKDGATARLRCFRRSDVSKQPDTSLVSTDLAAWSQPPAQSETSPSAPASLPGRNPHADGWVPPGQEKKIDRLGENPSAGNGKGNAVSPGNGKPIIIPGKAKGQAAAD